MQKQLRSEFKKLLSVRSTFIVSLLVILASGLFTYIGTGPTYVPDDNPPAQNQQQNKSTNGPPPQPQLKRTNKMAPSKLKENLWGTAQGAATPIAVIVILLMAHEYRYNMIIYTLTNAKRRSSVVAAKIVTGLVYTLALMAIALAITVAFTYLAVHIRGLEMPPQDINWVNLTLRSLFYGAGTSMIALAIITLVRNLAAGVVIFFLLPALEGLISVFLRHQNIDPAGVLPVSALQRLITDSNMGLTPTSYPSVMHAMVTFSIYLIVIWAITWLLFIKRDAT